MPGESRPARFDRGPAVLLRERTELAPEPPDVAAPPSLATTPDARALWKALQRRWLRALTLGLLAAGIAAGTAYSLVPPKYTAEALLHIAADKPRMLDSKITGVSGTEYTLYQKTQAGLIKSRFVVVAALRQPGIAELSLLSSLADPVAWLIEELKVEYQEGSEILRIALSGGEPVELAKIVNAVKDAYLKEIVYVEREKRKEQQDKLEQIKNASERLQRIKRAELQQLVQTLGTNDPKNLTFKQKVVLEKYAELQKEHMRVQTDLRKATVRLSALQAKLKNLGDGGISETDLEEALDRDPDVRHYAARVEKAQAQVRYLQGIVVRPDEPSLVRAKESLKAAEENLHQRRARLRKELLESARRRFRAEVDSTVAEVEGEVARLTEEERAIRAQVEAQAKEADKMGPSSVDLEILQGVIAQDSKVLETVTDQLARLQIEAQAGARVNLLQAAEPPRKPDVKKQLAVTGVAGFGALGLVVFGVAFVEFRSRRIGGADEITQGLRMPVMGALPVLRRGRTKGKAPSGVARLGESVDSIRTMLLRAAAREPTQVLLISSATNREGKTTLASQLAASLARAGRRTVLVDFDLRHPALHQLFEQPLEPGVCNILADEIDAASVVKRTPVGNLWMIAAGRWDEQVPQLLAQDGVKQLFDVLRNEFDFVILDSFPILAAVDSLMIAQHVDGVILSVLNEVSRADNVYTAYRKLVAFGVRVLGTVVSGEKGDIVRSSVPVGVRG
jgi:capsular exopolysaccharide synthesis family protein